MRCWNTTLTSSSRKGELPEPRPPILPVPGGSCSNQQSPRTVLVPYSTITASDSLRCSEFTRAIRVQTSSSANIILTHHHPAHPFVTTSSSPHCHRHHHHTFCCDFSVDRWLSLLVPRSDAPLPPPKQLFETAAAAAAAEELS